MKLKNILLSGLSLALVAALAIGGTLAYLQDNDSDVNVMTLGNVSIEQIEQEWNAGETALQDFTQAKPLYPYVGNLGWENTTDNGGAYRRFTMNNVVDKYVSVKNTGKSDAYVRTIIALEMGDFSYADLGKIIGASTNNYNGSEFQFPGAWDWTDDFVAEIDGKNYNIMVAVHKDAIEPGETTIPSLLQVYMNKDATNEDCEKIDGNGNGTYDILVVSQAVQAAGFDSADAALDAAFGDITITNHPWANGVSIPVVVATTDELSEALAAGKDVVLTDDVVVTETISIPANANMTLNLNGNDITGTFANPVSLITNNGDLTIEGEGEISVTFSGTVNNGVAMNAISNRGNLTINGGKISNTGTGNQIGYAIDNYNGSSLTINGGEITASGSTYYDAIRLFCGSSETVVTVNGGEISSVWAQNPSANKATEVKGTVIVNGGNITTVYYENYTTVKVADGVTTTVTPYGAGSDNTTSASVGGYTVYSFVH